MNGYEIMIVDDSPFTVKVLQEMLEKHGHTVIGAAGSLEEVKQMVQQFPELVTMDMTLPGTDGFECSRAIHAYNPLIKIIAISSMKDDEMVSEALRHNISAYIQKPIDENELIKAINATMSSDDIFDIVENNYVDIFKEAFRDGVQRMTTSNVTFKKEADVDAAFASDGFTCVINMVGKYSGRMLFGMSKSTAAGFAVSVLRREPENSDELTHLLMEMANIVSGNAVSALNAMISKRNRLYNLRLAPPSVFIGEEVQIFPPDYNTKSIMIESVFGNILLNVGFKKGD